MNLLKTYLDKYLNHCALEKRLDDKTIRAYRCDLTQFFDWMNIQQSELSRESLKAYLAHLNSLYSPATTKRKIASTKAFCTWCEDEELIKTSPFRGMRVKMREPQRLPKTIKRGDLQTIVSSAHERAVQLGERSEAQSVVLDLRDGAVVELLIATGMRISELCNLDIGDYDRTGKMLRVTGKGSKERTIAIGASRTQNALEQYLEAREKSGEGYSQRLDVPCPLFLNRFGKRLSPQAARGAIRKLAESLGISDRITPHMFRHTFATMLLEQDVDIRYIQKILGHSSLKTTEIYTHVTSTKLDEILSTKNPRDLID